MSWDGFGIEKHMCSHLLHIFFGCREGWSFSQKKSIGCQLGLLGLLSTAISERQIVLECCWNTACLFSHTKNMYLLYSVRICEVVHVVGWSIAICGKAGKCRILCQWGHEREGWQMILQSPFQVPLALKSTILMQPTSRSATRYWQGNPSWLVTRYTANLN